MHTLSAIGRFIRRTPPPPADLLEAYAHEVIPVLDRAEWLYGYWLEQSTLFTDSEKLGNVAAIHRWETATMGRSLERVIPPSVLADAHESVIDALEMASRAAQLLSNGSRFHNANAVCEGHAMLTASRERRLAALRSMRRYLSRVQPAASPEADATSSETLAEAGAPATHGDAHPRDLSPVDPAADGSPPVGPTSDVAAVNAEPPVDGSDAGPEALWPELAEIDLILTDAAEPEPVWLSAARNDAPSVDVPAADDPSDTPSDRTIEPIPDQAAAESTATAPVADPNQARDMADAVDPPVPEVRPASGPSADASPPEITPAEIAPPETAAPEPSSQAGWGSLFRRAPDQSGR